MMKFINTVIVTRLTIIIWGSFILFHSLLSCQKIEVLVVKYNLSCWLSLYLLKASDIKAFLQAVRKRTLTNH